MKRIILIIIILITLLPSTAQAGTVSNQLSLAVAAETINWSERQQALIDYRQLRVAPGRDFIFQHKQIMQLARHDRLAPRAASVMASLRAFGEAGDKPIGTRILIGAITVQRIAGAGWQVHPLASAGRLNARAASIKGNPAKAEAAGRDLARIAVNNKSRYEHLFPWLGSKPGWISAMPQAVLASAYTRIWHKSDNDDFRHLALAALRPLRSAPPRGTTLKFFTGSHALLYPFRPNLRVANAQLWTTLSVDEVGQSTGSLPIKELAQSLMRQSLRELPNYADPKRTRWTLYAIGTDPLAGRSASSEYHALVVQALRRLCASGRDQFCPWADYYGAGMPKVVGSYFGPAFSPSQ